MLSLGASDDRLRVMLQREEYSLSFLVRGHEAKTLLLHPTFMTQDGLAAYEHTYMF